MATWKRFEDLEAWKRARELNRQVYRLSAMGTLARDFEMRNQLRRASLSVMANIAEGFGRAGRKEFIQFLGIARGSAAEIQSHLYGALDVSHIDQPTFDNIYNLGDEVMRIITGLMSYLQRCEINGSKFLSAEL